VRDADERDVVVETTPGAALEVVQPECVLELTVIMLDRQRNLPSLTRSLMSLSAGRFESQYLTGWFLPAGHSQIGHATSSSRSSLFAARRSSMFAGRTLSARNRDVISPRVPSRQLTSSAASAPAASARSNSDEGSWR
jgi:hypothetical protein